MKKISLMVLSVTSSSIFTVAAWAVPARAPNNGPNQAGLPSAAQLQSVTPARFRRWKPIRLPWTPLLICHGAINFFKINPS